MFSLFLLQYFCNLRGDGRGHEREEEKAPVWSKHKERRSPIRWKIYVFFSLHTCTYSLNISAFLQKIRLISLKFRCPPTYLYFHHFKVEHLFICSNKIDGVFILCKNFKFFRFSFKENITRCIKSAVFRIRYFFCHPRTDVDLRMLILLFYFFLFLQLLTHFNAWSFNT